MEIIGINSAAFSKSINLTPEDEELSIPLPGLNFAIPSNLVKKVVNSIIEKGDYKHAYLGIEAMTIDPAVRLVYDLDDNLNGVLLGNVTKGSPAEIRGLKQFDIITSLDNIPIKSMEDIYSIIDQKSVGDSIKVGFKRGDLNSILAIELTERPKS